MQQAMPLLEALSTQLEQLKSGDSSVKQGLIEYIWSNFTRLSVEPRATPMLRELYDWAEANANSDPDFHAKANITEGFIAFLQDQFEEADAKMHQAKDAFTKLHNTNGVAASCIAIGFLLRSKGELDLALKNGLSSMQQLRTTDDFRIFRLMGCYWIGSLYADTDHLDAALLMFDEGMELNMLLDLKGMESRITSAMAGVYMKQKKYDLALENFQKALDLSAESEEYFFRSRGFTDLADYYYETGELNLSIQYNLEALALRRTYKQHNASITNLMNLGRIYFMQKNCPAALEVLLEALQIAEQIHVKPKTFAIHGQLSEVYESMGEIEFALEHYKRFHNIKEAVNHEDLERKVRTQVQLFQAEQIEKENVIIRAQKIEIEKEKKRSEELLRNILPEEVAEELKSKGSAEARQYDHVTVLFTDFKNFTGISETMTPQELVAEIHSCFKGFDTIIEKYGVEKIKTIGDSYMCAGGLPVANETHAIDIVRAGLEIQKFVAERALESKAAGKEPFLIRIGVHTGPVVAGIVGIKKFAYDIWGDTVNTASRMESSGEVGKVNISQDTYEWVKDHFRCKHRGKVVAKGKGEIDMYFVEAEI